MTRAPFFAQCPADLSISFGSDAADFSGAAKLQCSAFRIGVGKRRPNDGSTHLLLKPSFSHFGLFSLQKVKTKVWFQSSAAHYLSPVRSRCLLVLSQKRIAPGALFLVPATATRQPSSLQYLHCAAEIILLLHLLQSSAEALLPVSQPCNFLRGWRLPKLALCILSKSMR